MTDNEDFDLRRHPQPEPLGRFVQPAGPRKGPELSASFIASGASIGGLISVGLIIIEVVGALTSPSPAPDATQWTHEDTLFLSALFDIFLVPCIMAAIVGLSAMALLGRHLGRRKKPLTRLAWSAVGGAVGGFILAALMATNSFFDIESSTVFAAVAAGTAGAGAALGIIHEFVYRRRLKRHETGNAGTIEEASEVPETMGA